MPEFISVQTPEGKEISLFKADNVIAFESGDVDLVTQSEQIVADFLEGKVPPTDHGKLLTVFNGTVGSGKTEAAHDRYAGLDSSEQGSTVFIAYDEYGALHSIHDYRNGLAALKDKYGHETGAIPLDERLALKEKYKDQTHYIFYRLQQEAIKRGLNVMIDMTLAGPHNVSALQPYLNAGYEIALESYVSGRDNAMRRVDARDRPLPEDEKAKYGAWFESAHQLIDAGFDMRIHWNHVNGLPSMDAISFCDTKFHDLGEGYFDMSETLQKQGGEGQAFIEMLEGKFPELVGE